MLGWLVNERAIEPHIPVFDKTGPCRRKSLAKDFAYDRQRDTYICPAGMELTSAATLVNDGTTLLYRASKQNCDSREFERRFSPKRPTPRSIHESRPGSRARYRQDGCYVASRREREKIDALFAQTCCSHI
ncbi:hypothetical protein LJR220_007022 [Bradyrhizobium sp. LjRoot220]|uniref:hypothetical protein n=1 Tax=Bradyrhizobium sp. LjRoot220 TaxID=3342284 RepID=UPI003ECEF2CB